MEMMILGFQRQHCRLLGVIQAWKSPQNDGWGNGQNRISAFQCGSHAESAVEKVLAGTAGRAVFSHSLSVLSLVPTEQIYSYAASF
jgi:hypothetical protein